MRLCCGAGGGVTATLLPEGLPGGGSESRASAAVRVETDLRPLSPVPGASSQRHGLLPQASQRSALAYLKRTNSVHGAPKRSVAEEATGVPGETKHLPAAGTGAARRHPQHPSACAREAARAGHDLPRPALPTVCGSVRGACGPLLAGDQAPRCWNTALLHSQTHSSQELGGREGGTELQSPLAGSRGSAG